MTESGGAKQAMAEEARWYAISPEAAVDLAESNGSDGLTTAQAQDRLREYGPNELTSEPPPSRWAIAAQQFRDPMNLMLVAVAVVSLLIEQRSTAFLVAFLVLLNVVIGTRQELKARASVDALAQLQVPQARVVRDANLVAIAATDLVPGDIVHVESGDIVPADGRVLRSATLEVQEAALTGESQPVAKDASTLPDEDVAIGDRHSMLFENTSVTRGTAVMVVSATGMDTEMGRIATMLGSVERTRSPLQKELDSLTKILGVIAWGAVVVIVAIGWARGLEIDELLLLGTAMAISAIPTGMPTFVQGMLAYGAKQLAEAKAVVTNLSDVETLGSTSAINTDKTGTLTLNQMTATRLFFERRWFAVDGEGYSKQGTIRAAAGAADPDLTPLAYGLVLASDATVSDSGEVVGDPTEAALIVLAAKAGVDAEESRRAYPRLGEVPFDSEYKFMATAHRLPLQQGERLVMLTKGAPDVVLARCTEMYAAGGAVIPIDADVRATIAEANGEMASKGLRVLAFAARVLADEDAEAVAQDLMPFVESLRFVALVGIVDPLRPTAKAAVDTARTAGIEVRMITGDYVLTARAIGEDLGLESGAISGTEMQALDDDELRDRIPDLHVFGRVSPEDKLRLVRLMQEGGQIVAMTGDAVNDAAALKQADIGVAMGTGSEVSKQAAKMVLTDDNFGTLVHAVELGRSIYQKVVLYVRYQMSQLLALVVLFLAASLFNINSGVALTPSMVLFLNFLVAGFPVVVIILEPVNPGVMKLPPRDPSVTLANPWEVSRWALYGSALFLLTLGALYLGPDDLGDGPSVAMTMAFVVMAFGTLFSGLAIRRDPGSGLTPPILKALGVLAIPALLTVMAVELAFMQQFLDTQPLTGNQWVGSIALAAVMVAVVEGEKAFRRRKVVETPVATVEGAVAPDRAVAASTQG